MLSTLAATRKTVIITEPFDDLRNGMDMEGLGVCVSHSRCSSGGLKDHFSVPGRCHYSGDHDINDQRPDLTTIFIAAAVDVRVFFSSSSISIRPLQGHSNTTTKLPSNMSTKTPGGSGPSEKFMKKDAAGKFTYNSTGFGARQCNAVF
jgi:hypothetical protein